jgi:hypothetical protein
MRLFRHRVRGTTYHIVGYATGQFSGPDNHLDMTTFVVYRGADGHLWVRPEQEFFDGRFEEIGVLCHG